MPPCNSGPVAVTQFWIPVRAGSEGTAAHDILSSSRATEAACLTSVTDRLASVCGRNRNKALDPCVGSVTPQYYPFPSPKQVVFHAMRGGLIERLGRGKRKYFPLPSTHS